MAVQAQCTDSVALQEPAVPSVKSSAWKEATRDRFLNLTGLRRLYWRTRLTTSRHRPYMQLLAKVAHLDGDVIECGVFRGRSLLAMGNYLRMIGSKKKLLGLDSFDGFPLDTIINGDLGPGRTMEKVKGRFRRATTAERRIADVSVHLGLNVETHAGYFEKTLPEVMTPGRKFCFVHLDCDIYQSYITCLEAMYDSVVPGGIILFDEYGCPVWPGAKQAVDEFFADKPEKPLRCEDPGNPSKFKHYILKQ